MTAAADSKMAGSSDWHEVARGSSAAAGGRATRHRVVSPALVGRSDELARIVSAISVPPAVVLIEGEAGVGKSRLVAELSGSPDVGDRRFLTGSCRRVHESFPLGPVIEAVRRVGHDLARVSVSPVAGALRALVPEIADWLPPAPEPLDDRAAERHRVFRGFVEVLASLGPSVLVVEDIHWADEQTVDFVAYLVGDPPEALSVVLTFRGDELDPRVRAVTGKLPSTTSRTDVALTPLGVEDTAALAKEILGTSQLSGEFVAYLCERASGVPFAIEELLALLRARGTLVWRGGGWARKALDELDVPPSIRDSVLERVSGLSAGARSAVETSAVLDVPVTLQVLVAASGLADPVARHGVEEALDAGMLASQDSLIGPRHVLAAQAVYGFMPAPRRRYVHSRAAEVLAQLDPIPLGQLARHLRHAGRRVEWVGAAERAADQAVVLGHEAEAVRILEDVLRHAPLDAAVRGRVAVKLARAVNETLDGTTDVAELLSGVPTVDLPAAARGELRFMLAVLLDSCGNASSTSRRLFQNAIADLHSRPDLLAAAMAALAMPALSAASEVSLAEHRGWLELSLETVPGIHDEAFQTFLLGKVAMVKAVIGDPIWRDVIGRVCERTGESPRTRREINAHCSVGLVAAYQGHYRTADQLLSRGVRASVNSESRQLVFRLRSAAALLDFFRGRWNGLAGEVDQLIEELADYAPARVDAELVAGCLALARGDLDLARRRLTQVVDELKRTLGGAEIYPIAAGGLVRLALTTDEVGGALTTMREFLDAVESKGFWGTTARALPTATEAMVAIGCRDEAQTLIERATAELRDLDTPLAPAALRHARGFLDADAGRWSFAAESFLEAARRYESRLCPYEAAQAREQAAVALFMARDPLAPEPLEAALATYQRLGATWDHARAAKVARRHGVTQPARHRGGRRGYGTELSPREEDVVALAAQGKRNREIAAQLFVSVKTVEGHLTTAMRKLGVSSRMGIVQLRREGSGVAGPKNQGFPS
jgi:DNA-binding CsgD family transcriptional regulator/tetratricopeptide (TPR) repeat protein